NGQGFFLVWADSRDDRTGPDIYGTRLAGTGQVTPSGEVAISLGSQNQASPAMTSLGTNSLVVWVDYRKGNLDDPDLYGARINRSGEVLDPNGIAISTTPEPVACPAAATDGTNALIIWQRQFAFGTGSGDFTEVRGTRVTVEGLVPDPNGFLLTTNALNVNRATVAGNAHGYLVVWTDLRNTRSNGTAIYAARVSSGGTILDAEDIPIAAYTRTGVDPSVAASHDGYMVVEDLQTKSTNR
ncbi:MAG TPA: hypothetical protein VGK40_00335, partial [Verrucomicrobiae bacterium]